MLIIKILKNEYFDRVIIEKLLDYLTDGPKNFDQIQGCMKIDRTRLRNVLNELDGALIREYQGYGRETLFEKIREKQIDRDKLKTIELEKKAIPYEITSYESRKRYLTILENDFKQFDKMTQEQKTKFNSKISMLYLICLFEKLDHSMFEARGKDFALMHPDLKHWTKQKAKFFLAVNKFIDSMEESHRNQILNDVQILKKSKSAKEIEAMFEESFKLEY